MYVGEEGLICSIKSGTKRYPSSKDVYSTLLTRLSKRRIAWASFTYTTHSNWLRRLLSDGSPSVGVTLAKKEFFELGFALPLRSFHFPTEFKDPVNHCRSRGLEFPATWLERGACLVPVADLPILVDWLDMYFKKVQGCPPEALIIGTYLVDPIMIAFHAISWLWRSRAKVGKDKKENA